MKGLLVVIPCGQGKIWDIEPNRGAVAAADAYTGAPFKVNRAYAEHFAEQWLILSAKYGLVDPRFRIPGPYNVTFKDPNTKPVSVEVVRRQVREQSLDRFTTIIGLGGKEYRTVMAEAFADCPAKPAFPFAGLPIGKAMQAIKLQTVVGSPMPPK